MVDPIVILILGIVFGFLSVSDRLLTILREKGLLKKLQRYVHKNKNKIEASLKSGNSSSMIDDSEFKDIYNEVNESIIGDGELKNIYTKVHHHLIEDDLLDMTNGIIDLVSISQI